MDINNRQQKSIRDAVFEKIRSGGIKMNPKIYFVLKTILIIVGAFAVAVFILFLISFISFALRVSGVGFLPEFGFRGFGIFFSSFPWILILIAVVLILALMMLIKRFGFVYRKPILYSLLAIILIVFLGGFILDKTPLHSGLFLKAREGKLPLAGPIYRGFGMREFRGIHRGVVSEITENGFIIETPGGNKFTVIINADTKLLPNLEIKKGNQVVILGKEEKETINAVGIHKIDDNLNFPLLPPNRLPGQFK
jgi:hypothetical protein